MSDYKEQRGSFTKLQVISPYLLIHNDKYAYLDYDFERDTIQFNDLFVSNKPLLIFKKTRTNCYINIMIHEPAEIIAFTCKCDFNYNISVEATLVTKKTYLYLLNINQQLQSHVLKREVIRYAWYTLSVLLKYMI